MFRKCAANIQRKFSRICRVSLKHGHLASTSIEVPEFPQKLGFKLIISNVFQIPFRENLTHFWKVCYPPWNSTNLRLSVTALSLNTCKQTDVKVNNFGMLRRTFIENMLQVLKQGLHRKEKRYQYKWERTLERVFENSCFDGLHWLYPVSLMRVRCYFFSCSEKTAYAAHSVLLRFAS